MKEIFKATDFQGKYPLHYAIENGREDNLQLLLMAGHFVPDTLLESTEILENWKESIKTIVEKRNNASLADSQEKTYP